MLTPENCIQLCIKCPNREFEDGLGDATVTGDLITREPHYINRNLEFVRDPAETSEVPVQEFGVTFRDSSGNLASGFLPGVQLEDIANCSEPILVSRSGFLWRKRAYDCGAQALKLVEFRRRIDNPR